MAVFENSSVLLELKDLPYKEKKKVKAAITENGGHISFVVNKQCSLIVASDVSNLSSNRLRSIRKYQTPVVGVDYVRSCVDRGVVLPVDGYELDISSPSDVSPPLPLTSAKQSLLSHKASKVQTSKKVVEPTQPVSRVAESSKGPKESVIISKEEALKKKFRVYTETDTILPTYPEDFQVAKYSIFQKGNSNTWFVLELQSFKGDKEWLYRVVSYRKDNILGKQAAVRDKLVVVSTSEEALEAYSALRETLLESGLQPRGNIPAEAEGLCSVPLQQLLLEEKLNTGSLSQEVGVFVEMLWTEALGCLSNILSVPIDKLSLNDVSRAEGLLLQAQKKLKEENHTTATSLLSEVYTLLPHKEPPPPCDVKLISQKLYLCQLIRDVLNVSEMNLRSPVPSSLGKYRALGCSIEAVPPSSSEFNLVTSMLLKSSFKVKQVLRVSRGVELQTFKSDIGNVKTLFHSSSPSNFVGVLSRGLLMPRYGVEFHGIQRRDAGDLGSGIYFTDHFLSSVKYSKPSETDGSRLLLVCDVALGNCMPFYKKDHTLTQAPEGHHSVHGVLHTRNNGSEFTDNEFVVYSPDQVKLKYVVQYNLSTDEQKEFSPAIDTSAEPCLQTKGQELNSKVDGVESVKNPLEDVTAGLLDSSGQKLPLQAVHVKCKLMDMLSQVIIFQKYTNQSSVPIEAKYVFPLDDSAAVCGFEAFINGKHVVGQVKEKETARKEYKQAIEKGHGAYLMDQDAPDVFTISVGNLPPGATVLIKVTYVSELIVRDGSILFSLPGSVAPWQESAALNQTTQVTVEKVCVTDEAASTREFTLDVSVEMPYEITSLKCITHKVKMKKTDCKAVVSVLPGEVMSPEGFQLSVTLSQAHMPRMWVEKHPDKDSQACMLVFYPNFDVDSGSAADEVVLLVDTSESMKGESLSDAQRIALQVLKTLHHNLRVNVIFFGTDHTEAFLTAQPLPEARAAAESFIRSSAPVGGSTELWRPLRALSLLPPSCGVRNLLLLSDGHVQNADVTLKLLRDNAQHSRLFTCGLSPTANRHMLRALAQAGGGAYEFFDTKTKHNWAEKVASQLKRMTSPGCSSVSVKWQQFNPAAPPPVQAPQQLHALFSDCHTLVYGFVPHCTQATLLGNLSGQELKTMVSTSELQKTKGTFLHKLTARALIRDYEDGSLDTDAAEHEGKKAELKHYIIELSKEFSILSQFTSFVAIEERDSEQTEQGFTDIPKLIAEEDVDLLPYMSWTSPQSDVEMADSWDDFSPDMDLETCCLKSFDLDEEDDSEDDDMGFGMFDFGKYRSPGRALKSLSIEIEDEDEDEDKYSKGSGWSSDHVSPSSVQNLIDEMEFSCPISDSIPQSLASPSPPYIPTSFEARAAPPPPPPPPSNSLFSSSIPLVGSSSQTPRRKLFGLCPPPATLSHDEMLPFFTANEAAVLQRQSSEGMPKMQPCILSSLRPISPPPAPAPDPAADPAPAPASVSVLASSYRFGSKKRSLSLRKSKVLGAALPGKSDAALQLETFAAPESASASVLALKSFQASGHGVLQRTGLQQEAFLSRPPSAFSAPAPTPDRAPDPAPALASARVLALKSFPIYGHGVPPQTGPQKEAFLLRPPSAFSAPAPTPDRDPAPAPASAPVLVLKSFQASGHGVPQRTPFQQEAFRRRPPSAFSAPAPTPDPAPDSDFALKAYRVARRQKYRERRSAPASAQGFCFGGSVGDPKWPLIFRMQHSDGYWESTKELGMVINVDMDVFANVFLKNKGISSLGVKAHADILRLVATLLVLQLMRLEKTEEGKLLRTLFCLEDSPQSRPEQWAQVKKAVDWVCWADRQYPCVYSRLEFGLSWESSTRQLLGFEGFPPLSSLSSLNLQLSGVRQPVC